jgi:hypothetical protein
MNCRNVRYFKTIMRLLLVAAFSLPVGGACFPEDYFGQLATSTSTAVVEAIGIVVAGTAVDALFGQTDAASTDASSSDEASNGELTPEVPDPDNEPPPFP